MAVAALLRRYEQVILDLDGCVWIGPEPIPGSLEAINAIREAGLRLAFVTNNSWMSGEDLVTKLWGIGVQASLADVVTVGGAMQHLLAETPQGGTAYVTGSEAMFRHVRDAGLRIMNGTDLASRAEVVVVGATFDLTYDDLKNASLAARRGADFLATGRDPTYPMPDGFWPGTGSILVAVGSASGRTASIVGKPEPPPFFTAIDPPRARDTPPIRPIPKGPPHAPRLADPDHPRRRDRGPLRGPRQPRAGGARDARARRARLVAHPPQGAPLGPPGEPRRHRLDERDLQRHSSLL